ncbi:MAG: hypothetical protein FWF23_00480 [Alphaproteobacteria bacterium]|nr:hypothetical protein [Alphaproteobacteria bacterium]MCL2504888.1 hypothetical protein [Alphaproteobacteria bacterium]
MFQNHDYNVYGNSDETLERLVLMTAQTNLVALDKTIASVKRSNTGYAAAAARVGSIGERIIRAAYEIGMTLPQGLRARLDENQSAYG